MYVDSKERTRGEKERECCFWERADVHAIRASAHARAKERKNDGRRKRASLDGEAKRIKQFSVIPCPSLLYNLSWAISFANLGGQTTRPKSILRGKQV